MYYPNNSWLRELARCMTLATVLTLGLCGCSDSDDDPPLSHMRSAIESELDALIAATRPDAESFAGAPLTGAEAEATLSRLAAQPYVIDALTVDSFGIVQAVKPDQYTSLVSTQLADDEWLMRVRDRREPLLSDGFLALEGYWSVALEYPLHSGDAYRGSTSLLVDHMAMFSAVARQLLAGTRYSMTIQQLDGVILWDNDANQVGLNVLTSPSFAAYPDVVRQVREVIAEEEGEGRYQFHAADSEIPMWKRCAWTTIRRAGAEWRLALFWAE